MRVSGKRINDQALLAYIRAIYSVVKGGYGRPLKQLATHRPTDT